MDFQKYFVHKHYDRASRLICWCKNFTFLGEQWEDDDVEHEDFYQAISYLKEM